MNVKRHVKYSSLHKFSAYYAILDEEGCMLKCKNTARMCFEMMARDTVEKVKGVITSIRDETAVCKQGIQFEVCQPRQNHFFQACNLFSVFALEIHEIVLHII